MMEHAHVPQRNCYQLWKEAFGAATLLDGLTVLDINGKLPAQFEHWDGRNPDFVQFMRTWGEAGTVKLRTAMTPKIFNRGVPCMMVGYAENHASDTYCMWEIDTNGIHGTRDVVWLRRMYFPSKPQVTQIVIEEPQLDIADGKGDTIDGAEYDAEDDDIAAE
jgi:hypothetical protein